MAETSRLSPVQVEYLKTYIDTLAKGIKALVDARFESIEQRVDIQFTADHKATLLAYQNMERRLDSMNEFRAALDASTENNITKSEFNQFMARTDSDIRSLRESRAEISGKATQEGLNRTTMIAVVGIGLSLVGACIGTTGLVLGILTFGLRVLGM